MGSLNNYDAAQDDPQINILVVEDNLENLRFLNDMLTNHGYLVRPASSGTMALRSIESFMPDIILLDIKMPDMDGYEVCEILSKDVQTREIPIIFISGMKDVQDKVHAFEVGGMDYITKPFLPDETLARIKVHLELATTKKKLRELNAELEERVLEKTAKLKESETKYRLLAENIADVIWTTDNDRNLTYISPSIKQLRGYSPEEALKEPFAKKFFPESLEKMDELLQTEISDQSVSYEGQQICKDGSTVWVEMKIRALHDETGRKIGVIGCSRDITTRKHLESNLRRAQKMEALGTLAGGIAHDFKNILSIIFGFHDLALLELRNPEKLRQCLSEIRKSAGKAKDLINQILTFCRMTEKKKRPLRPAPVLREALKLLRHTIPTTIDALVKSRRRISD